MSKFLDQRQIATLRHVWSLTEEEKGWLDSCVLMRSYVNKIYQITCEGTIWNNGKEYQVVWTQRTHKSKPTPVILSFREHWASDTKVVLVHPVTMVLSAKAQEIPEYEP